MLYHAVQVDGEHPDEALDADLDEGPEWPAGLSLSISLSLSLSIYIYTHV